MKALISSVALLTFLAATTLPTQSYAQTATGGAPTMAPDTGTAPTTTTKKSKRTSKSHVKKKSNKPSSSQTSSAKQPHDSIHTGKHSRHIAT